MEAKKEDGSSISVKELERARKNLEYQLTELQNSPQDDLVNFEDLGVDALFVDEAHYYKDICCSRSFGNDTLHYSATALFAVHSEDLLYYERGTGVKVIMPGIVSSHRDSSPANEYVSKPGLVEIQALARFIVSLRQRRGLTVPFG